MAVSFRTINELKKKLRWYYLRYHRTGAWDRPSDYSGLYGYKPLDTKKSIDFKKQEYFCISHSHIEKSI